MLHYALLDHSSSARLTLDTSLCREEGRTEKRWHIINQNNGRGYSKDRHNDAAVTISMIGQKVSRRVRWFRTNFSLNWFNIETKQRAQLNWDWLSNIRFKNESTNANMPWQNICEFFPDEEVKEYIISFDFIMHSIFAIFACN